MPKLWDGKLYLGNPELRHAILRAMIQADATGEAVKVEGARGLKVSAPKDRDKDLD